MPLSLVGNGFTTTDARTGRRISVNVQMFQPWPQPDGVGLNARFATEGPGPNVAGSTNDPGFAFANCGSGPGRIVLSREGYETLELDVTFPIATNINYALTPSTPVIVPMSPLTRDGQFFRQGGDRVTLVETSDYSAFKRFLELDPTCDPVTAQRQVLGYNLRRVWLLNSSVVGLRNQIDGVGPVDDGIAPRQYPNFYERLREFCQINGNFKQNVEVTVFTQTQTLMPDRNDQQRHLDATADAVRGLPNVLIELVNENDQHDNAVHPDLVRPSGVLISRGSNGAGGEPNRHDDPWDYEVFHSNSLFEWQRKVGHNAMEFADQSGRPILANENTRYADNDNNLAHAEDAAEGAALLIAGSCYHSQQGKFSRLFTGDELNGAVAWVRGARSVPVEFQAGAYRRLDPGSNLRVYSRVLGDGREHIVEIRN